ncbi:MAG: hypothetical protein GY699_19900, partial [Desulfobacteraceae bacterium]|nr:hypothetical protein [Desulfobacteraceae bacterium]
ESIDKIIKKCDAARYFILHKYGGIYADLDTVCIQPIDKLINDFSLESFDIIFSEETQDSNREKHWKANIKKLVFQKYSISQFVGNAIIISKPSVNFWIDFLRECFQISYKPVLESFSTWHLTKFLNTKGVDNEVKILNWKHMLSTKILPEKSYFMHHYDATWFNLKSLRPWEG